MSHNINVKFEDIHLAIKTFDDLNIEMGTKLAFNDFIKHVKKQTQEAAFLLNCPNDIEYIVQGINFVNDEKPTQAYFESVESTHYKHFFKFYIRRAFRNFIHFSKGNFDEMDENNLWLHELVHSKDFQQIRKSYIDTKTFHKKKFRESVFNVDLMDKIAMLDSLRCEGIATLVEAMYDNELKRRNNLVELLVSTEKINKILDSTNNKEYKYAPYIYGKYMVLKTLFYLNMVDNSVITDFWLSTLENKQLMFCKLLADENIIENLFKITLDDFIVANFMPNINLFPFDISQVFIENLTKHLYIYQENKFENEYSKFLIDLANQKPENDIITQFQDVIGSKMSDELIIQHYKAFNFENVNSLLLKSMTEKVYQSWLDTKSEIDYYKLTFLFDDQDIIDDDIPLIGYLDDIIVLQYSGC